MEVGCPPGRWDVRGGAGWWPGTEETEAPRAMGRLWGWRSRGLAGDPPAWGSGQHPRGQCAGGDRHLDAVKPGAGRGLGRAQGGLGGSRWEALGQD